MNVLIIGGGNMGMVMAKSLLDSDIFDKIYICEKNKEKWLSRKKIFFSVDLNKKIVDDSSVIIIAVKPQDVSVLSGSLKSLIDPRKLLISIAAGISMKKLKTLLNHQKIVRVMPNTPALIKSGISLKIQTSLEKTGLYG